MIQQVVFKILLLPFSLLYGVGVSLRDFFYRKGVLKGIEFDIPVISVGNLSLGGAGKTPHIEYLIRLLSPYISVATLSRGYKRKTKGFRLVNAGDDAKMVGDEPLQFKRKFSDLLVTVSESRTFAVPRIMQLRPDIQTVLLDDAFQHRSIKPGLNILLTEYKYPFTRDFLLPSGRLREWRSSYKRADMIIISKCPDKISEEDRGAIIREVKPFDHQRVYFSKYSYSNPFYIFNKSYEINLDTGADVLLICAIARTDYLLDYLNEKVNRVQVMEYEDHHYFTKYDIAQLQSSFERLEGRRKIILTTEKDAMRMELHHKFIVEHKLPMFVLPIEVKFMDEDGMQFDSDIKDYLLNFRI